MAVTFRVYHPSPDCELLEGREQCCVPVCLLCCPCLTLRGCAERLLNSVVTGGTLGCFPSHWLPLAVDPLGEVTEGVKRAALLTCPGRASVCLLDFSFCKTVSRARLPVPQHISSSSLCPFLFVFFCNDCDWKAE